MSLSISGSFVRVISSVTLAAWSLAACGLAATGKSEGDGRTHGSRSATTEVTGSALSTSVTSTTVDGRTHLEILIAGYPKVTRDYDFPVSVSTSSSSLNGVRAVEIVVRDGDGEVVETITP
jgi:hypothetical protein